LSGFSKRFPLKNKKKQAAGKINIFKKNYSSHNQIKLLQLTTSFPSSE
jgi:hypothetical protein